MSKAYRRIRYAGRNRHHFLQPKVHGGGNNRQNLLLIDIERHQAWHKLFGTMTAEQALRLLSRVIRAKRGQGYGQLYD